MITDFDESSHDYRYWLLDHDNTDAKRLKTTTNSTPLPKPVNKSKKPEKQSPIETVKKSNEDGFSRTFDEINSKPIDYWLLN